MDCVSFEVTPGFRIGVNMESRENLLASIESHLTARRGFSVATINLDHLVKLRGSDSFRRAYAAHTHVVADGNPIVWASQLSRRPVNLVPGCELLQPVCEQAARHGAPVALLGSTEETLASAGDRLRERIPGLQVAARISPSRSFEPEGPEADACIERIRRSGARVVFLALGAPKQEVFAARAQAALPDVGFLSIGAGLDFIAGSQKRAPKLMRRLALEWLWRAGSNPRRLAQRYARCAVLVPGLMRDAIAGRLAPVGPEAMREA